MKRIMVIILMIFAIGCAKKQAVQMEVPAQPKETAREEVKKDVEVVQERISPRQTEETPVREAKEGLELRDALFDYNKYDIRSDAVAALDSAAGWLNSNKSVNILVEGHCDDRGTNEYNLALGEKRAKAAKDYLAARGISASRINTISYGEERPACKEQNEDCWQKNRRAHFIVTK